MAEFYSESNREMAFTLTGSTLAYNDLISAEDREFWQYLCKKDFRRLEKLLTQSMGEGHFVDDSGDDDSDDDENPATNNNKRLPGEGDEGAGRGNDDADDDEEGGLNSFLGFRNPGGLDRRRGNVGGRPQRGAGLQNQDEDDDLEHADEDNWLSIGNDKK